MKMKARQDCGYVRGGGGDKMCFFDCGHHFFKRYHDMDPDDARKQWEKDHDRTLGLRTYRDSNN